MEWGSDDMPATGDSEYEETEDSPRRLSGGKDPDQPTRWIQLIYLDPGTDQEGDEDQEILFAPRVERVEEPPPAPERVQATTDCEIITMVKTLNETITAVS